MSAVRAIELPEPHRFRLVNDRHSPVTLNVPRLRDHYVILGAVAFPAREAK